MGSGYLYDIARHFEPLTGLAGTYCGDGDGDTVKAFPMSLPDSPAAVVLDGEQGIIAGPAERWQISPELHIYVAYAEGIGAAYERARSFKVPILVRVRASITSTEIATGSFVLMRFREIEDREWPIGSGRHYWVLPCEFQARVNVPTLYNPPTPA